MCLILLSYKQHPDYPLIIAANRDEFYARPSLAAHYWSEAEHVLAGRDMEHGGTWLGVTAQGRLAALTNFRDPAATRSDALSRGSLVADYLTGFLTPEAYIDTIKATVSRYNGFNLLLGDRDKLLYYSSRTNAVEPVSPGIHGLSNHLLDTPWPKVERGKMLLAQALAKGVDEAKLFSLLEDKQLPADESLPDTGVGLAWERILSPLFIATDNYGTRAMTVIVFRSDGLVRFSERSRLHSGEWVNTTYQFMSAQKES